MFVYIFYLSGDRHSLSSLAIETACPADESWKFGDHRVSGAGVWMHKCFGLQVLDHVEMYTDNTLYRFIGFTYLNVK